MSFRDEINTFTANELSPPALGDKVVQLAYTGLKHAVGAEPSQMPHFQATVDGQPYVGIGSLLGVREEVYVKFSLTTELVLCTLLEWMTVFMGGGDIIAVLARAEIAIVAGIIKNMAQANLWAGNDPLVGYIADEAANGASVVASLATLLLTGGNIGASIFAFSAAGTLGAIAASEFLKGTVISTDGVVQTPAEYFANPPESPNGASEIIIGSTVPFNRKIDVQLDKGRTLVFHHPAGIYDDAARAIQSKFGDLVEVTRISDWDFPGKYRPKHDFTFTSPALVIRPRSLA